MRTKCESNGIEAHVRRCGGLAMQRRSAFGGFSAPEVHNVDVEVEELGNAEDRGLHGLRPAGLDPPKHLSRSIPGSSQSALLAGVWMV